MDFKLFWLICLLIFVCPFGHSFQLTSVTTKSPINGLKSSSPLPPSIETNSSINYELLSPKATEPKASIDTSNGHNNTSGQLNGKDILTGQEQNQNQYFQGRVPPNRFPPQFNGNNYNYGAQPGNMPQGLPRPRQPNFGNQMKVNQRDPSQQLPNPYDFLNGVVPSSGPNGFRTQTPMKQQPQPNQPFNGYPIGTNYPSGLNPNRVHGNVGDKPNQGFGLTDKPSDGYNDQSGETESPEQLGDQSDGVNEEAGNEEAENGGGGGEDDGGNEEVTPYEESTNDETNGNDEVVDNNNDEGVGEGEEGADEGDGQADFDDARAASSDSKGGEATANDDESTDADGSAGQEQGEQDPSNDPDLAQFQNFQGGNFPGDLFPPGILSQQDLQEIQKSMEEQQRKEAEKQKAEEEAAAAQNEGGEDGGGGEENGGVDENSEGGGQEGGEGEIDQPAASPPAINPYIPVAGYGRPINNQPNLLDINRALAGRVQNPRPLGRRPYNPLADQRDLPRDRTRFDGGFTNRGGFGTGIQDYEYEKPKIDREEDDEVTNRLRENPVFNRNRFFPSHRQQSNDDEDDEENEQDDRRQPPYMRNRFANRFDRFRPRLFGRPGRYNNDLGDYGVHRANSNQQPSIDYKSNPFTIDNGFNPSDDNQRNTIKQSLIQGNGQSLINYENEE